MRVYGYIRVSQVRGRKGESFVSPTSQREVIERWAAANGAELIHIFEDLDESGGRVDRPHLVRCVEAIESGEADGMVVAKLDRFFRDQLGGHATLKRIRDAKGFLAIPGDGIDTRDQMGKQMLGFLLTIAEVQRDGFRAQFADARARAIARGIHICPVPPVGYTRPVDETGKVLGPLEPDLRVAPHVRRVFELRADGESLTALASYLEANGVRSAYGAAGWTSRAAKAVIRNRVYLGEARHGEFVNAAAHDALTDELTWRRAQRPGRIAPARGQNPQLLAGLLRCAGCRYSMKSYVLRGTRQFACHRKHPGGECREPAYISTSTGIDGWVRDEFFAVIGRLEMEPVFDTSERDTAEQRLKKAEAAVNLFRDDPDVIDTLGADGFKDGLRKRQREFDEAYRALAELEDRSPRPAGIPALELREVWDELSVGEQRRMLATVIDAVFVRRGRSRHSPLEGFVHVCLRGEAPAGMPRRGVRGNGAPQPFLFPHQPPASTRVPAGE